MLDSEKMEFAALLGITMRTLRGEVPDVDVLRLWWSALCRYELQAVRAALSQYTMRGKFAPVPADILEILDKAFPDGRPGPDEAWSMVPRDEATSAVLNDEIGEAMQAARPLLNEGDQIAARMAFKEAYTRIVDRNKLAGLKPKWFPSLGHDPEGREHVLNDAVAKGLLSSDQVAGLLPVKGPTDSIDKVLMLAAVNGKLVSEEERTRTLSRLLEMKSKLKGAA